MKRQRYSVGAAIAVAVLSAALMLGCFASGEQGRVPLTGLPSSPVTTGIGHSSGEGRLDINTATTEELDTLPGIGPVKAEAIVLWRNEHGAFRYPEDLIRVSGIGEGTLAKILDLITAGGE